MRGSLSRRGNPYDNAQADSFIKAVECEEVYLNDYETSDDVAAHLRRFLDQVYNERRLHSALGYLSPMGFEARHAQRPKSQNQPVQLQGFTPVVHLNPGWKILNCTQRPSAIEAYGGGTTP